MKLYLDSWVKNIYLFSRIMILIWPTIKNQYSFYGALKHFFSYILGQKPQSTNFMPIFYLRLKMKFSNILKDA